MRVLDKQNLPQILIAVGCLNDNDSSDWMLEFIVAQNKDLRVTEWKVLRKVKDGTITQINEFPEL